MVKICLVVSDMFHFGGAERVAANLANSLCEKYEITLISAFGNEQPIAYSLDQRIKFFYIVNKNIRLRYCYFSACRKLNKILNEVCPDITLLVHASTYVFLPSFWKVKTKCIACEHMNLQNKFSTASLGSKIKRRCAVLKCNKIVTLTQADKENYIKKYRLADDKVVNIYNWIEPELLNYFKVHNGQDKKIITVGRFDPVKGYEMLVEVAKEVLHRHTDWVWHIYGTGDSGYKHKIQQMIEEYQLENRLVIKEPVKAIYEKYPEYSFFVLTSYYEGLPMVLLEAQACGLPVISFASPTGPEEIIVNGVNGDLVPCYDIGTMINKVDDLINNSKKIQDFSQKSSQNIEKFQKEKILKQWEQLFDSLIGER